MNRKYSIFISSTYEDLKEERRELLTVALGDSFIPVGMEQFGAHPSDKWDLITRMIDECDVYMLIIGGRYGSVDSNGVSWTEREYDYAKDKGLPVITLIQNPIGITADKMDKYQTQLSAFREKVKAESYNSGFFNNLGDLKYEALHGLNNAKELLQNTDGGWVRYADVQDIINNDRKQFNTQSADVIDALSRAVGVMSDKIKELDDRTTWHVMEPIDKNDVDALFDK